MQKTTLNRLILTFVTVFPILVWLYLSYTPEIASLLPVVSVLERGWGDRLQAFTVVGLGLFLLVQVLLVHSLVRIFQRQQQVETNKLVEREAHRNFRLNFALELFWTLLPLVMTAGLAWAAYRTWLSLPSL
jgi:heme/copper-type cytochrome/quinol oxidase subunit 2